MYRAIRGYKYQHCPVLSGLNKTQLGELVNKFDLNVEPTGKARRPTGRGLGRSWNVPNRKKTTWKSMSDRTTDGVRYTGLVEKRDGKMVRGRTKKNDTKAVEEPKSPATPQRKKLKKVKLKM